MAEVVCVDTDDLIATVAKSVGTIRGIALVDTYYYLRLLYRTTAGAWSAARSLAIGPRAT